VITSNFTVPADRLDDMLEAWVEVNLIRALPDRTLTPILLQLVQAQCHSNNCGSLKRDLQNRLLCSVSYVSMRAIPCVLFLGYI
jgi:hypothetical protein